MVVPSTPVPGGGVVTPYDWLWQMIDARRDGVRVTDRRTVRPRSSQLAWLITGPLTALTIVLLVPAVTLHGRPLFAPLPVCLLYLVLFAIADAAPLYLEYRRHGMVITLTEIPMLLALFHLPPLTVLCVRIVPLLLVQIRRRIPPVKLAFNVANTATYMAAATLIVAAFGPLTTPTPHAWLVLLAATTIGLLLNASGVILVISLMQGGASCAGWLGRPRPAWWSPASTSRSVSSSSSRCRQNAWSVVLLVVLAGVLVVVYRAYAQLPAAAQVPGARSTT